MFFNFLGADFVALKSDHRCEKQSACIRVGLGIPTKIKMKNTCPKKICKTVRILLRYCHQILYFLLCYVIFYISRYPFTQIFRTSFNIIRKKYFSMDSLKPPSPQLLEPFNCQNTLIMMKIFCQCSHFFFGDPNFKCNAPDSTKIHYNIISL